MERRTFLTGAGVAALLPVAGGAAAKDQSLGDGGTAAGWRRILGAANSYTDLEPALLGRIEELIDFVTAPGTGGAVANV